jgi:hypothetical protein
MLDSADRTLIEEPIEPNDATDPIDPIDRTEPTLPIDKTEPTLPIDRTESRERMDHLDLGTTASVVGPPSLIEWARLGGAGLGGIPQRCALHRGRSAPGTSRPGWVSPGGGR